MSEALAFLTDLFGETPGKGRPGGLKLQLWTKADKRSHYFPTPKQAAPFAEGHQKDCYVSVSLASKNYGPTRRAPAAESAGVPGLWADIDVNGGPEDKSGAAPDFGKAWKLANALLEPTVAVHSGYGLQCWWLFEDGPWIFGSQEEREQAARMAAGWVATLRDKAQQMGFGIDATQDLARLMRIPGTLNCKGGQEAPVQGWWDGEPVPIKQQDGPFYKVEQLGELTAKADVPATAVRDVLAGLVGEFEVRPDAEPPFSLMDALLQNSTTFRATWEHNRRDRAAENWTLSEYDLSLASQAVQAGWSDQQVADLLVAHRRKHADRSGKGHRPDYLRRTIGAARREKQETDKEEDRQDALANLEAMGEQAAVDPDAAMTEFNRVLRGPFKVKELYQDGDDPKNTRYRLVLDNGVEVPIGPPKTLLNPDEFREALMTTTRHVLPMVKRKDWLPAIQALLTIAVVTIAPDDTRQGQALEWLSRYLSERLTTDQEEAARRREPFEKDGHVHVYAGNFATFVNRSLGRRISDADVKQMLKAAGFTTKTVTFENEATGKNTSRSYYHAPKEVLDG